jgi:uncharacterized protein (DUF1800 family)
MNRLSLSFFFSLMILAGCGSGVLMASGPSAQVSVAISGASQIAIGAPVQYTAAIAGTANTAVTWSVVGASAVEDYGTISPNGLYMPPAAVPVHTSIRIVATSVADATKSSSTAVTLSNPVPSISTATLTPAQNNTFLVDVRGSNFMPSSAVIYGGYGRPTTYVSASELKFTMTNPPPAGTLATMSVVTPAPGRTQSENYSLAVPAAVSVAVAGGGAIAAVGSKPMQFTATVTGSSNAAVTWSISGASPTENYGTISSTGLYTPPSAVPVHTGIAIVATSIADTTKSAAASVTIQQPTPAITGATLTPGSKGSYLVDVTGSGFVPSSSAVPGSYGVPTTYLSASHLQFTLTSPPALGSSLPLSVINPAPGRTQSASYNLVISTTVAVTLTGPATALIGTPTQYTATVTGVANTAVTWTIKAAAGVNYGSISAAGLYTPPPTVPGVTNFTLVATSVADTTKSASLGITISNPVPVITSATLTPGYHNSFLVDVYGTGFLPVSQAQYLGYGAGSTYLSGTHLQFTILNPPPAGTVEPISVITPAPGRTQSALYNMTIPGTVAVKAITGAAVTTIGTTAQYTATVTGTPNTAVTWTLSGPSTAENYGTVSSNGLYTPPAAVPAHNYFTLTATSTVDTTKSASIPVTIMNKVPAITSAATATVAGGAVSIDVKGVNFLPTTSVWFSGYGLVTTYVSPTELTAAMPYTTVAAQTAGAPITIWTVTPNPGRVQSANFSVTMPGAVGVTVTGSNMVAVGTPSQYVAAVTGTTNTAVTWSVKAAAGVDPGTISASGLYTPPVSIAANTPVTIVATSEAEPSSNGTWTATLVSVPVTAAARLLDQSTFGPTDSLIEHVQTIGLTNYVDEQLALPPTVMPLTSAFSQSCGSNPSVCIDEDYWSDIVTAPDQLRQRVAMALGEMLVISYEDANPAMVGAYSNMLTQDAFANWSQIMKDMTLSPGMGMFLNMANSGKPPAGQIANENFARENMQLFNLGLNLLNQDGTVQTDSSGNPIPAYTEAQVEAFSRVFTGWTYAPASGSPVFPNYNTFNPYLPMVAFEQWHDTSSKVLLNSTLPAGQTAEQDLAGAIQDVFNHPNVGPFVTQQLIQHLVKSNPSPAYVGRISAVFANDGKGVRGNMAAVIKAILLDPEARAGDTQTVENDGLLREPILWTAGVLRGLNAVPKPTVTDNSAYTAIDSWTAGMQEPVFYSPTVFNYYPASYDLGTTGLQAPQFALETSATIMTKLSLASSAVDNLLGKLMVDLSATGPLGTLAIASNDLLLDELNKVFLHGTMSSQMRSTIESALSGITDPAQRVRTAVYLVITSSQFKVIH